LLYEFSVAAQEDAMCKLKACFLSFLILFGLWLIIAGTTWDEWLIGGFVSLIISLIFAPRMQILGDVKWSPQSLISMFLYLFIFLGELFKSAIDVALRVLARELPINPGIVKVRTKLKSRMGRIVLANSITLTPGTMTVETIGEFFYIHWIDIKDSDIEATTKAIVSKFEKHLEVLFG
jgi:multicomponent Na+:H+ antiporter subunit E